MEVCDQNLVLSEGILRDSYAINRPLSNLSRYKALTLCASSNFTTTSTNNKATRWGGLVLIGCQPFRAPRLLGVILGRDTGAEQVAITVDVVDAVDRGPQLAGAHGV